MRGLVDFEPDAYYHLVNHAVGFENLFRSAENYRYFLERYAHYMPPVCHTLAYCLMPNHIHFLVKIHPQASLSQHPKFKSNYHKLVMQEWSNLLNAYAKAFNKRYGRRGALWIDYTKRFPIDSDDYLTNVISYIHHNPVKHGFTKNIADWPHSSYHGLVSDKNTRLNRNAVLEYFGGVEKFQLYHCQHNAPLAGEWEY